MSFTHFARGQMRAAFVDMQGSARRLEQVASGEHDIDPGKVDELQRIAGDARTLAVRLLQLIDKRDRDTSQEIAK